MTEQFNQYHEDFDPQVKKLFDQVGNEVDLRKIITPDGHIRPEVRDLFGQLGQSMVQLEKLVARLFEGHSSVKEWRKLAPTLNEVAVNVSTNNRSDDGLPGEAIPWEAKQRQAKEKLPPGLATRSRYGKTPRKSVPGNRGTGRYSGGK